MNNKTSRNDFIPIIPQNVDFKSSVIQYGGYKIYFNCNENILKTIVNRNCVHHVTNNTNNQNATITVLVEKNLLDGSHYDLELQDGFIPKSHPVYNLENQNKVFSIHKNKILKINYYPYHFISTCHHSAFEYEGICGNIKTAEYISKILVKQALIDLYYTNGYYPIHAAAICDDAKNAYLFLAGSHSGKTTIFLNLILDGFFPMNDDILMLRNDKNQLMVHAVPILPNIRQESLKFIPALDDMSDRTSEFQMYQLDNYREKGIFKAVFLPRLGYKKTNIYRVEAGNYKTEIIKAFSDHHKIQPDEKFLYIYKQILAKPLFIIELSTNMRDFPEMFKKALTEIQVCL